MKKYYSLLITADPSTDIWVGDSDGHFVQKETGRMVTSLLPGKYTVSFGLKGKRHPFLLGRDTELRQADFE